MDTDILAIVEAKEAEIKAADAARKAEQDAQDAEKKALIVQAFEKFLAGLPPAVAKYASLNEDESSTYAFKAEFSVPGLAPIEYRDGCFIVSGVENGGEHDGETYPPSYVPDRQSYTQFDFALTLAKRRADYLARLTDEWQEKKARIEAARQARQASKPAAKGKTGTEYAADSLAMGLARAAIDAQAETWEEAQARALVSIAYSLALMVLKEGK